VRAVGIPILSALAARTSGRHHQGRRPGRAGVLVALLIAAAAFTVGFVRTAPARERLPPAFVRSDVNRDGTWTGWGESYHGRVLATIVITRGRITSATITTCRMRYPCRMIEALPQQVVDRQGPEVDMVTGATQSAQAFAGAVQDALSKAVRPERTP
jgi:uncharacterized protein with FMN-binding domain